MCVCVEMWDVRHIRGSVEAEASWSPSSGEPSVAENIDAQEGLSCTY